jgi:hypothetical protein
MQLSLARCPFCMLYPACSHWSHVPDTHSDSGNACDTFWRYPFLISTGEFINRFPAIFVGGHWHIPFAWGDTLHLSPLQWAVTYINTVGLLTVNNCAIDTASLNNPWTKLPFTEALDAGRIQYKNTNTLLDSFNKLNSGYRGLFPGG